MIPCPTCGALPCDQADKTPMEAVAWRGALEEFIRVGEETKANPAPRDDEFGRGVDAARIEAANEALQALAVIPTEGGGRD